MIGSTGMHVAELDLEIRLFRRLPYDKAYLDLDDAWEGKVILLSIWKNMMKL